MGRRRRVLTVSSALLGAALTLVTAVLAAVAAFLTADRLNPPVQFARNPCG
jgi:hypothetical protein